VFPVIVNIGSNEITKHLHKICPHWPNIVLNLLRSS